MLAWGPVEQIGDGSPGCWELRTLILKPLVWACWHPKCQYGKEFGSAMMRLGDQRRWMKLLRYNLLIRDKENAN